MSEDYINVEYGTYEKERKERLFKSAGVEPLSEKVKRELERKQWKYGGLVRRLKEEDAKEKPNFKKARKLEMAVQKALPTIPNAKYVHAESFEKGCGMRTAIYYCRTPQGGSAGGDDVFFCLFCEKLYE